MQVEVFSLCDAATIQDGKLNILGAFDTILISKIPGEHPQCAIALRLRFNSIEAKEHLVSVKCVDADGAHIIPSLSGKLKIKYVKDQRSSSANLILNVQRLKLEKAGEYSIDLKVDGKSMASIPFYIKQR